MGIILHIAKQTDWDTALRNGSYKVESLNSDGFIHCSTVEQVVDTANAFFGPRQDLLLLCLDEEKLESEVKFESPTGGSIHPGDALYPHVYGPLNMSAVLRAVSFVPGEDGRFQLPSEVIELTGKVG